MRHRPDGEISDSKTEAKETKKLAGDAPFHHVEPLGFHLLPGVPSSIIAKIKTIWLSARHPPTLAFFQPPHRTGSSGRESGERSPLASFAAGTAGPGAWETGLARPLSQQQPLPPAQHLNLAPCFRSTVCVIFTDLRRDLGEEGKRLGAGRGRRQDQTDFRSPSGRSISGPCRGGSPLPPFCANPYNRRRASGSWPRQPPPTSLYPPRASGHVARAPRPHVF